MTFRSDPKHPETHAGRARSRRRPTLAAESGDTARAGALAAADERMAQAKHRFSLAALACLRGASDAAGLVAKALEEVDGARAAIREAGDA